MEKEPGGRSGCLMVVFVGYVLFGWGWLSSGVGGRPFSALTPTDWAWFATIAMFVVALPALSLLAQLLALRGGWWKTMYGISLVGVPALLVYSALAFHEVENLAKTAAILAAVIILVPLFAGIILVGLSSIRIIWVIWY